MNMMIMLLLISPFYCMSGVLTLMALSLAWRIVAECAATLVHVAFPQ